MALSINFDEALHAADVETIERRIMDLALTHTSTQSGALFLWDAQQKALAVGFHVVEGVTVNLPGAALRRRRDGRPNGIAFWVFDHNEPYLCKDTTKDPNYAPYFLDVSSVAAVPIPYQERSIGVLSVSSRRATPLGNTEVRTLERLAAAAAKFLRRAQLYRATRRDDRRPFLIKGLSAEWLEVERRIEKVSETDAPVLVQGESGTGKDLVANFIHFNSKRAAKPFVTVNCAAIPETLLESTLFGHVKGAFTGANVDKVGELEKAHGGTLFLDELGELPMGLQAKVLRAVEQGEATPLGSNRAPRIVDVRLICATNRNLDQMVREGRFRDDLYYRLGVMTLELPPLRSYRDLNIEVLAAVFVQQAAKRHGKPAPRVSESAMALLRAYDFPGNVRELRNALEHAIILCGGGEIVADDLPRSMRKGKIPDSTRASARAMTLDELRESALAPAERKYLAELLEACGGNVRKAARRARVNPVTLYRLMEKRGVRLRRRAET
jgi:DNA-binding NtrC family response regulator